MTLWTVARQASLPIGFSRQEYWSELPFPSPGDLPGSGIELKSPALQADLYHLNHQKKTEVDCHALLQGLFPRLRDKTHISDLFLLLFRREMTNLYVLCVLCLVTQSCPALCDPLDCSPSLSQDRLLCPWGFPRQEYWLEQVAKLSSRGSSQSRDYTQVSRIQTDSLPFDPREKP